MKENKVSDCIHGFPGDWNDKIRKNVLNGSGCPSCMVEKILKLEAELLREKNMHKKWKDQCEEFVVANTELGLQNQSLREDIQHIVEGLTPSRDELQSMYFVLAGIIQAHKKENG